MLIGSQHLDSSTFHLEFWQPWRAPAQVGFQTGAWSGTLDLRRPDDCDDSESGGQRQSQTVWTSPQGDDAFHLPKTSSYSYEYQSHRRWNWHSKSPLLKEKSSYTIQKMQKTYKKTNIFQGITTKYSWGIKKGQSDRKIKQRMFVALLYIFFPLLLSLLTKEATWCTCGGKKKIGCGIMTT